MSLSNELVKEIDLLNQFSQSSVMEGIKIHHTASPELIAAGERLFNKGLIERSDGGYLTQAGIEALNHVKHLMAILNQGHI